MNSRIDVQRTCAFCGSSIPAERLKDHWRKTKYCCYKCTQRSGYIRRMKQSVRSSFRNRREWETCRVGKGYMWEVFASNLLGAEHQQMGKHYDLLWHGKKVDVKATELYKRKMKYGKPARACVGWWVFHVSSLKQLEAVDQYFCIGLVGGIPEKIYLFPKKVFLNRPGGITVSRNGGKYDRYLYTPHFQPTR